MRSDNWINSNMFEFQMETLAFVYSSFSIYFWLYHFTHVSKYYKLSMSALSISEFIMKCRNSNSVFYMVSIFVFVLISILNWKIFYIKMSSFSFLDSILFHYQLSYFSPTRIYGDLVTKLIEIVNLKNVTVISARF